MGIAVIEVRQARRRSQAPPIQPVVLAPRILRVSKAMGVVFLRLQPAPTNAYESTTDRCTGDSADAPKDGL